MIPSEECRNAKDAADYNTIHGIAKTALRFNSDVTWNHFAEMPASQVHDIDWDEVTEIQFSDGSVWRLNQNHTPPTIVTRFTEIDTRGVADRMRPIDGDIGIED